MKKIVLTLLAIASLTSFATADEATHRASADELLEINKVRDLMQSSFMSVMEPNYQSMEANGMPKAAIDEFKGAVTKWYGNTMKWELIGPKFAELYMKEFSEEELKQLIAFYKTELGQKAITKMPVLMQEGSKIGQDLASKNQDALGQEFQAIMMKYKPAGEGAPGAGPMEAPAPESAAPAPAPAPAAP